MVTVTGNADLTPVATEARAKLAPCSTPWSPCQANGLHTPCWPVLGEYVAHYNEHRPHQGRHQRPPNATDTTPVGVVDLAATRIRRRKILDGLINEYSQAA
jgi:hypothetical protein